MKRNWSAAIFLVIERLQDWKVLLETEDIYWNRHLSVISC